jgi:hypothetical protein
MAVCVIVLSGEDRCHDNTQCNAEAFNVPSLSK